MTKSFVETTSKEYQNHKNISDIFGDLRKNKFSDTALNVFKSDCQELIDEFEVERDNFIKNRPNGHLNRGPNPVTHLSQVVEQISNIENEYSQVTEEEKKDYVNQSCFDILRSIHAKLKHLPNLTKTENEVLRKTQNKRNNGLLQLIRLKKNKINLQNINSIKLTNQNLIALHEKDLIF